MNMHRRLRLCPTARMPWPSLPMSTHSPATRSISRSLRYPCPLPPLMTPHPTLTAVRRDPCTHPAAVIQTAITQIDAHSSQLEFFYIPQYQNDNFSVIDNVHDSSARFHEDYSTTYVPVHARKSGRVNLNRCGEIFHHPFPAPSSFSV